jgi:hypothetical protein
MAAKVLTDEQMEIYASRVISIYNQYMNIISPMIDLLEVLDGEYPIEIMNEIRAVFTHLSRYYTNEENDIKVDNVIKAEGHIKRAILDCFKYSCFAYSKHLLRFETRYKKIDLSLIDNGQFLDTYLKYERDAVELFKKARKTERNDPSSKNLFSEYQSASKAFDRLFELLDSVSEHAEKLKRKAVLNDYFTVAGFVVGIIGVILTVVSMF